MAKQTENGAAAQIIHKIRKLTNLSVNGLAELIRISPSTVSRIERGESCPSYDAMLEYVRRAGYSIAGSKLERRGNLKGYKSAKEIGDFINEELSAGLDSERLSTILRIMPKLVIDWRKLSVEDLRAMALPRPNVTQAKWQALLEGIVRYYFHVERMEDAPAWTRRTRLKKKFVPRGESVEIGGKYFDRICAKCAPEFAEKNIIFSRDEMQLI
jgi:transcriptional regulator with XRE-family HTH domain